MSARRAVGLGDLVKSNGIPHPLGRIQTRVLLLLVKRGRWFRGCGWRVDAHCETERVLDTLVTRGLARIFPNPDRGPFQNFKTYAPTAIGGLLAADLEAKP